MSVKKEENAVTYCSAFTFNASEKKVNPILVNDNPYFIAIEICDNLGLSNVSKALNMLDDDERLTLPMVRSGQNRKVNLVNESGLYNLIFRSNKPEARLFRKWVTNEVLPAIRKNGHFSTTPKEDPAHQEVSDLIIKATRIAGIQRILARYLNVSESVLTDIRNRPGKISGKLTSRVAEGCRQIIKTGEVPEGSMRSLNVLELNQMWFDIALIESYEVRKRISQRMKRILGREDVSPIVHSGMYENVTVSQEGGRS